MFSPFTGSFRVPVGPERGSYVRVIPGPFLGRTMLFPVPEAACLILERALSSVPIMGIISGSSFIRRCWKEGGLFGVSLKGAYIKQTQKIALPTQL
jgi:hypothetical protein